MHNLFPKNNIIMAEHKFQRFNHKYTHCTGEGCELREDCIHFLAWIEAYEHNLKNIIVQERCTDPNQDYVRVRIEPPDDQK